MKGIVLAISGAAAFCLAAALLPSGGSSAAINCAAVEQTILRLISDPVRDAVETFHGPHSPPWCWIS